MKDKKRVFHTGYMYRYNPYVKELIEQTKSGKLGQIISVEAQMNCIHTSELRQWLEVFPGGMMFYLGCHLIDLVLQIQGIPERIVPFNKCTNIDGVTAQDFGMAVLEYENGVSLVKTNACEIGGFKRRQLVVTGTKGTVELKPLEICEGTTICTEKTAYFDKEWHALGEESLSDWCDRYENMMMSFSEYVNGTKANPYSYDYELALFKTIKAACGEYYESNTNQ